jgi:hypothetical protein
MTQPPGKEMGKALAPMESGLVEMRYRDRIGLERHLVQ